MEEPYLNLFVRSNKTFLRKQDNSRNNTRMNGFQVTGRNYDSDVQDSKHNLCLTAQLTKLLCQLAPIALL